MRLPILLATTLLACSNALATGLQLPAPAAHVGSAPATAGEPAWDSADLQAGKRTALQPLPAAALQRLALGPVAADAVEALRRSNGGDGRKRLRIGIGRDLADEGHAPVAWSTLQWATTATGSRVAQLAVASAGAAALRTGLRVDELPAGSTLRFEGEPVDDVPSLQADEVEQLRAAAPVVWSPVTSGEEQRIEVEIPAGADPRLVRMSVVSVSHLLVSPFGAIDRAKIGESDFCEIDTRCVTDPSTAYDNARNSVARIVFEDGGDSYFCTGTLLNDTDTASQVPYLFSAAHCMDSQAVASTVTTFWFYEASSCNGFSVSNAARQVGGGAQLLHANNGSDVLLLRLNNAPPAGSWYQGWDASALSVNTEVLVLHHPQGDVQKVSLGQVTGIGPSNLASGSFFKVGYTDGTTEGGSSGSGLLTAASDGFRLRGGLLGGSASCANTGNLQNTQNRDDFSRLDLAFPQLAQWLQPASNPPPANTDFSGAWSDPAQTGWGVNIIRGASGTYAMYIYHYDQFNEPAWYLSVGNLANNVFESQILVFSGPWFGALPFDPDAVEAVVGGTLRITFTGANSATLAFTLDGRTVNANLARLAF